MNILNMVESSSTGKFLAHFIAYFFEVNYLSFKDIVLDIRGLVLSLLSFEHPRLSSLEYRHRLT